MKSSDLVWIWRWTDGSGVLHMTDDIDEADLALHSPGTVMVLAERIKEEKDV